MLIDATLFETDLVSGYQRTDSSFSIAEELFLFSLEPLLASHGLQQTIQFRAKCLMDLRSALFVMLTQFDLVAKVQLLLDSI